MNTMPCSITDGPQADDDDVEVPEPDQWEQRNIAANIAGCYQHTLLDWFRDTHPDEYDRLCIEERESTNRRRMAHEKAIGDSTVEAVRDCALLRKQAN